MPTTLKYTLYKYTTKSHMRAHFFTKSRSENNGAIIKTAKMATATTKPGKASETT